MYYICASKNFKLPHGRVAERLGRGLQNLVQRFKSARDLKQSTLSRLRGGVFCFH